MTHARFAQCFLIAAAGLAAAAGPTLAAPDSSTPGRALTIYNQDFAVVRESVPMTLAGGVNHVTFSDITYHVEPDSVVLRDPDPNHNLKVLEQNYRADPITQERLLALFEGKTIDFQVTRGEHTEIVPGRIVRSGYVPHSPAQDSPFYYQPPGWVKSGAEQPLIEVGGKLQFSLPGIPLFPALTDDSILKPTLDWTLTSDRTGPVDAELDYVTSGLNWEAAYNVQSPAQGDTVDIVGWVTIDNQSGKSFENARIKLMAGDVNKIKPKIGEMNAYSVAGYARQTTNDQNVEEKAFDEYHLYTLNAPATLLDRETKQIEFVRASGVKAKTVYVYDGVKFDQNMNYGYQTFIQEQTYGTLTNKKVWVLREIANTDANHLGIPIPKGKVRFYRKDDDGSLQFTGEDTVDHTPKNETMRFMTGSALDLTGERRQTNFKVVNSGSGNSTADESFEIKVRNHKTTPVEIRVVEHLYRGANWTITDHSNTFLKTDSRTIEFRVPLVPEQEQTVTYTAHYTW